MTEDRSVKTCFQPLSQLLVIHWELGNFMKTMKFPEHPIYLDDSLQYKLRKLEDIKSTLMTNFVGKSVPCHEDPETYARIVTDILSSLYAIRIKKKLNKEKDEVTKIVKDLCIYVDEIHIAYMMNNFGYSFINYPINFRSEVPSSTNQNSEDMKVTWIRPGLTEDYKGYIHANASEDRRIRFDFRDTKLKGSFKILNFYMNLYSSYRR